MTATEVILIVGWLLVGTLRDVIILSKASLHECCIPKASLGTLVEWSESKVLLIIARNRNRLGDWEFRVNELLFRWLGSIFLLLL